MWAHFGLKFTTSFYFFYLKERKKENYMTNKKKTKKENYIEKEKKEE